MQDSHQADATAMHMPSAWARARYHVELAREKPPSQIPTPNFWRASPSAADKRDNAIVPATRTEARRRRFVVATRQSHRRCIFA
jgi:hypothetical protein